MKTKFSKVAIAAGFALIFSSSVSAQEIPFVGGMLGGGIPVLGSLPGGDVLGGGLLGLTELPVVVGSLSDIGLSLLGPYLENPQKLGDVLGGLAGLGTSSLLQPQSIFTPVYGLASANGFAVVPVFEVLINDPASVMDYVLGGGAILTDSIAPIPEIPFLNSPG